MIGNISDDDPILDYRGVDTAIVYCRFRLPVSMLRKSCGRPAASEAPGEMVYDHISLPWPLLMNPICHVLLCKQPSVATVEQKMFKDHSR